MISKEIWLGPGAVPEGVWSTSLSNSSFEGSRRSSLNHSGRTHGRGTIAAAISGCAALNSEDVWMRDAGPATVSTSEGGLPLGRVQASMKSRVEDFTITGSVEVDFKPASSVTVTEEMPPQGLWRSSAESRNSRYWFAVKAKWRCFAANALLAFRSKHATSVMACETLVRAQLRAER